MLKERLPAVPIPKPDYDVTRMYLILGSVFFLFAVSAAGVISGVGIFLVMLIQMKVAGLIASSLLLTTSLLVSMLIYGWLSA